MLETLGPWPLVFALIVIILESRQVGRREGYLNICVECGRSSLKDYVGQCRQHGCEDSLWQSQYIHINCDCIRSVFIASKVYDLVLTHFFGLLNVDIW